MSARIASSRRATKHPTGRVREAKPRDSELEPDDDEGEAEHMRLAADYDEDEWDETVDQQEEDAQEEEEGDEEQAGSLEELAADIAEVHRRSRRGQELSNEFALSAGEHLVAVKQRLGFGRLSNWVEKNLKGLAEQYESYIELVDRRETIDQLNPNWTSEWSMTEALARLHAYELEFLEMMEATRPKVCRERFPDAEPSYGLTAEERAAASPYFEDRQATRDKASTAKPATRSARGQRPKRKTKS